MYFVYLLCTIAMLALPALSQESYRVFRADGSPASLDEVIGASRNAEVVFLGEGHDDPTAHALELELLKRLSELGPVALSLEMFECDTQTVVDEYLAGWISEDHLEKSGRAWKNYKTDYRPMVEFAKERRIPVVAANAPRRYVNRVSREGRESLEVLPASARQWLPPLPNAEASEPYAARFLKLMEAARSRAGAESRINPVNLLAAQSLWDASMAYSIAQTRMRFPDARIFHAVGAFHSERRLGILDHLRRYRPSTVSLVVNVKSVKSFPEWDEEMRDSGDFVILTDPSLPRSFSSLPVPPAKANPATSGNHQSQSKENSK